MEVFAIFFFAYHSMTKRDILAFILKTISLGLITLTIVRSPELISAILMLLDIQLQKDMLYYQLGINIAKPILIISVALIILRFVNSIDKSPNYYDSENDARPYFRLALTIIGFAVMIKAFIVLLKILTIVSNEYSPFYKVVIMSFARPEIFRFILFIVIGQALIWYGKHLVHYVFHK